MKGSRWLYALALASSVGLVSLVGCVVAPSPYYEAEGPLYGPPPPHEEIIGVAPVVGSVWIGGYWDWSGRNYDWRPGHWEAPHPGYRWMPHRWEQNGQHWQHHGGRWEREH